jgi:hypothetical protein
VAPAVPACYLFDVLAVSRPTDFDLPLLPLEALDLAVRRLPADVRAQLRWSRRDVDAALRELLVRPPNSDHIADVTVRVFAWVLPVLLHVSAEIVRVAAIEAPKKLTTVVAAIRELDVESGDALQFAVGVLTDVFGTIGAQAALEVEAAQRDDAPLPSDEDIAVFARSAPGGLWRAIVVLTALESAATRDALPPVGRLRKLAWAAQASAFEAMTVIRAMGHDIDPYARMKPRERSEIVSRARETLAANAKVRAATRRRR